MDFDQLHAFLEVARLKSFSRAAIQCFRTQPAISAQIRLLEEEVGARLFDRSGGKVALTEAGRLWHDFALNLQRLRQEGLQAVGDLDHAPRGELQIAANEGSCLHVLPEVFAHFKRQHPAVQVRIRRGEHNDILEAVLENRVDFGVVSLPVRDPRLKVVPLHRDEILVAVAPQHPLAQRRGPVPPAELVRHPLLLPRAGQTREAIEELLGGLDQPLQVSMELDSTELLKGFAAAGLGVAFVARALAAAEQRAGELTLLPIEGKSLHRDLGLIFRRDRALGRAALAFIDIAVRYAANLPAP
ncbi:MAG TPA: LysR family transcriptional regulator [Terriglobales bacterium]|nr:LysR family transcriptional regulator [Terriglobales bacterium]